MPHFLTQVFNPLVRKISYFNKKYLSLKSNIVLSVLLITTLSSSAQDYSNIEFIQNKGQWDSRVQYKGNVSGGAFFIREGGFTVLQHNARDYANLASFFHGQKTDGTPIRPEDRMVLRSHAYHVDFLGASSAIRTIPDKIIPTYNNYIVGKDPSKWSSECRIYQAITLENVYPNIDVRYYTDNGFLKYDIVAKPGSDISKIALKYNGVNKLQVKNRELLVETSIGELKESRPYTYQADAAGRKEVNCRYVVRDNVVRFEVSNYDPTQTLIIDPTLIFCSFAGSTADNWGFTATYGPDGSMYGGGIVFDNGFPVSTGAFQTTFGGGVSDPTGQIGNDIGIIKLTPNGSTRVYATYIGGSGNEQPHSLIVDNAGNLVLAGRTNSANYPIVNPGGQIGPGGGYDIVVTKLNATGTALIGSKKIGGTSDDGVNISASRSLNSLQRNYGDDGRSEVILDGAGNVYVASCTQSRNFPNTAGFAQPVFGGGNQDGVILKLTPNLGALTFATYIGGTENDAAYVLSLAPNGDIYAAGGTESDTLWNDMPGSGMGPISHGGIDGFVAAINNTGTTRIRYAHIGTSGIDQVFGVQFDNAGFPYVMGQTTGNFPVFNATYSNAGGKQFIAKMRPDLSGPVYSTVFGSAGATNPNISPIAFLVDRCENVYISGWGGFFQVDNSFNSAGTFGLPVTPDAIKGTTDGKDMYFFVLKKDATALLYGSFFGENNPSGQGTDHVDGGTSRFDQNGVIYQAICGNCKLGNPPLSYPVTPGAWSTSNNSPNCNLTMVKIAMNLAGVASGVLSAINGVPRDTAGCVPLTVDFSDTVRNAVSYEWYFGDGTPFVATNNSTISHTYTAVGNYQVMLVAIDPNTCNVRDTSYLTIRVGDIRASLAFNPVKLNPCDSFKYRFDNLSTAPPIRPFGAQSFIWDFGDGSPRITTGLAPVFHSYSNPGTYDIKLILNDTAYCNFPDSLRISVSVDANVDARFSTPPTGCVPYNAVFRDSSIAAATYDWDFGDGGTSTLANPTHLYNTPGQYTIRLIARNPQTCNLADTAFFTINVFPKPVADFTHSPVPPVENTQTTFTNLSSPDAVSFRWDFGDGDTLRTVSRAPVRHQYNATGTFTACLTAYNAIGCDSTVCRPVQTLVIPLVDVPNAFTPNSGDINSVVMVRGFGISKMRFIIWNRWGQKVFETGNRLQGWDGRVKGVVQPMDVYAYTLEVEFFDGKKANRKGDITLIR